MYFPKLTSVQFLFSILISPHLSKKSRQSLRKSHPPNACIFFLSIKPACLKVVQLSRLVVAIFPGLFLSKLSTEKFRHQLRSNHFRIIRINEWIPYPSLQNSAFNQISPPVQPAILPAFLRLHSVLPFTPLVVSSFLQDTCCSGHLLTFCDPSKWFTSVLVLFTFLSIGFNSHSLMLFP